jgi:hypothetical protein
MTNNQGSFLETYCNNKGNHPNQRRAQISHDFAKKSTAEGNGDIAPNPPD